MSHPYGMTVVVPVFNAADHLERCVASLDAQSVGQGAFEVILINDGSTDGSLDLCRRLAATRPNYVVLDQPNGGVSAARNAGIGAARGRYIMFVDADDAISTHAIEYLCKTFDRFRDDVDLMTYDIVYVDALTNATRKHRRSKLLTKTGVYDVRRYPHLAQTTPNVCIRNDGPNTSLFPVGMRMGEDQYFNTQVLARRGVLGYCADATYRHIDNALSSSSMWDEPRYSFEDMIDLYSMLVELARTNDCMAEYAYALVLYNLAWRLKQDKLSLAFGTPEEREQNHGRLSAIARAIPLKSWLSSPDLIDVQRVYLMRRYGVVGDVVGATYDDEHTTVRVASVPAGECRQPRSALVDAPQPPCDELVLGLPRMVIRTALRTGEALVIRGFVQGPALTSSSCVGLCFAWEGEEVRPEVEFVDRGNTVADASQRCAWHFEVKLPPMDGKPYIANVFGEADGQKIPAFSIVFDLRRCNGRRINANVREFVDRRLTLNGGALQVGTIKDLPAWTMPVVVRLMRVRDKRRAGNFDQQEVQDLRTRLPKLRRDLKGTRMWLYVDASEEFNRDRDKSDGVVRLRIEDLDNRASRLAALLLAERIVSRVASPVDALSCACCAYATWERVADFTASGQTFERI